MYTFPINEDLAFYIVEITNVMPIVFLSKH